MNIATVLPPQAPVKADAAPANSKPEKEGADFAAALAAARDDKPTERVDDKAGQQTQADGKDQKDEQKADASDAVALLAVPPQVVLADSVQITAASQPAPAKVNNEALPSAVTAGTWAGNETQPANPAATQAAAFDDELANAGQAGLQTDDTADTVTIPAEAAAAMQEVVQALTRNSQTEKSQLANDSQQAAVSRQDAVSGSAEQPVEAGDIPTDGKTGTTRETEGQKSGGQDSSSKEDGARQAPPSWASAWQHANPASHSRSVLNTAAASEIAATADTHGAELAGQIIERADLSWQNGDQVIEIKLKPDNFGDLQITLVKNENGLSAQIRADKAETGHLLTSQIAQLQEALQSKGLQVSTIDIQYNAAGFDLNSRQQANPDPSNRPGLPRRASISRAAAVPQTAESAAAVISRGKLDTLA